MKQLTKISQSAKLKLQNENLRKFRGGRKQEHEGQQNDERRRYLTGGD